MAAEIRDPESDYRSITRRVVFSQVLFTAGHALTTGPFLSYFGQDLGGKGRAIALVLIVPETAGVLALFTRSLIRRLRGRKRVWIVFTLLARVLSLGIPLAALPATHLYGADPLVLLVTSLALSEAAQAIAYVAYLAWLADSVSSNRWGRFFAARNIGDLSVLLIFPIAGGFLRDYWKQTGNPAFMVWAYSLTYCSGVLLHLISMWPLLSVPEKSPSLPESEVGDLERFGDAFRNRSLRFLLVHNWWLAAANGLTQAAFHRFLFGPLQIGLGTTSILNDVMRAIGIPVSWMTGIIADRYGNKRLMIAGVLVASSGLLFWLLASPGQWWWVFGAYACWGAFPAVNITGANLVFKLAPAGDNAAAMALFRQIGGLLAGLSGLAGGIWLDRLNAAGFVLDLNFCQLGSFQILFLASLIGRFTSAVWLLPIREPRSEAPVEDNHIPSIREPAASRAGTNG